MVLWKFPKIRERLTNEINTHIKEEDISKLSKDQIDDIDYLGYFIKEVLRYDCPSLSNLNMMAFKDVQIDDLLIKKGTDI